MVLLAAILTGLATAAAPPELLVAAAADLAEVEAPLAAAFARATGAKVRFTTGASGMLARQIEAGAPYDVFLSANERYVEELEAAGRIASGSRKVYATGRLGLWSRSGVYRDLKALTSSSVRMVAMANPAHAPYGLAARQALERSGLWEAIRGKVVFGENVRQAFEFGESGNADAVITSWTLLHGRGGILLPGELHDPIRQAGGVVRRSHGEVLARRFLEFLISREGQAVLGAHGLGGR
ncbi:MAG: molybdate ABC transporter substrate-binding protein [Acidobacteria bacterium]|nr:molybdate ABC transporter substrate-binding protein [Acidobacteriota bacterium]